MNDRIKIVADSDIPFLKGVFEPFAKVSYLKGKDIASDDVKDADALIVRTRTRCDAALLGGSNVRMVATATIGTDHIDSDYCNSHGIYTVSAPGCNSGGVMQYVFTALYAVAKRKGIDLNGKTLGVVGVGNVGSRVAATGKSLGFRVLRNDPPKGMDCPLEKLLSESDIVTLHIPLWPENRCFAGKDFFASVKTGAIFINASRGEVVDDAALKSAHSRLKSVILDVWNNEPAIDTSLFDIADIVTPHIAGYSLQGKINGTVAVVRSVARCFGMTQLVDFSLPPATKEMELPGKNQSETASRLLERYNIWEDDATLRSNPASFERIRSSYRYRLEF